MDKLNRKYERCNEAEFSSKKSIIDSTTLTPLQIPGDLAREFKDRIDNMRKLISRASEVHHLTETGNK